MINKLIVSSSSQLEYSVIFMSIKSVHNNKMSLYQFLLNTLSSLLASTIFLVIIFVLLRPRISIAQEIALRTTNGLHFFKICNKSFFRAYDLKIELYEIINIQSGGNHIQLNNIDIDKNIISTPSLAKYDFLSRIGKPKGHVRYEFALQFKTKKDLKSILNNPNKFIRVQIEARHGLTGLQSIFIQDFDSASSIKEGSFSSGKNFNIV